jgi:hypothetical protein
VPLLRGFPGGRRRGIFFGLHQRQHPGVVLILLVVVLIVTALILRRRR